MYKASTSGGSQSGSQSNGPPQLSPQKSFASAWAHRCLSPPHPPLLASLILPLFSESSFWTFSDKLNQKLVWRFAGVNSGGLRSVLLVWWTQGLVLPDGRESRQLLDCSGVWEFIEFYPQEFAFKQVLRYGFATGKGAAGQRAGNSL